jgi:hypothetical protein
LARHIQRGIFVAEPPSVAQGGKGSSLNETSVCRTSVSWSVRYGCFDARDFWIDAARSQERAIIYGHVVWKKTWADAACASGLSQVVRKLLALLADGHGRPMLSRGGGGSIGGGVCQELGDMGKHLDYTAPTLLMEARLCD